MAEQNDLNNDNHQPYNNKQQSIYRHLFLTGQPTQNQSNIEPLLPTDQLYVTPQINNDYQINTQNNNLKSLNNTHFINARLNNGTISHKRKKLQILLIYLLYIMGTIGAFLLYYFIRILRIFRKTNSLLITLIISMLNIILASTMFYYTKKKQSSRTNPTSLFSFILCFISGINLILVITTIYDLISEVYFFYTFIDIFFFILVIYIDILIFIFYFFVFLFNLKSKCFKCCD